MLLCESVTAAIVGARRPDQIEEAAKAGDWKLAEEDIEQIEQLLKKRQEEINGK
jgi:aryl-alcohol dehydrogenase-like predicted oxidoreductase